MLHKNTTSLVNLTIFMVFLASFQVAATPFIAEATIEFDNQQYTIPYYQSYLPENGSDQVVLALPYELFYVKQDGKFVTELPRLTAAKLYEVSYHLAYFYMRSPSDRVQQQLEVASEYYFALLEEGIANESRKLALRSAFAVGSTAVAVGLTCVGTAVPTLGAGCAVAVTFAAGSGVTSVWTTLASKRSALERNELLMAVVSQFVADGRAFFDTDEFDQFHELYNDLISNRPISFENIDGMMQSLMLNDIKTFASAEVILELPQPDGLHFNKEVFLGLVSLGSAALPSSGAYKAVGTIANVLISGGLGVYGVIDDKNSRGEEITSADIQEQFNLAFESANLTLPVYFSDSRLGRHGTLLSQFSGEKISTSPSVSSTSVGSQVRLKFIDLPEGYQLSIRNGLNTWKYTTPASGDLFPVVTAGSENDLFWQLQSPDGELHIAEKKIGLTVSTTTTRNVYASGLSNGVKVGWNGLPIGYDGVLVCMSENLSAVPGNLNEPATLPTGICATSDWQVKGVKASSSGSFDFTGLKQAQVYQFSVYSYDKVPAEYNSDGELVRAAYFRFSDAVQVEARTDINGILSTVDWPASGFHPYRITGELIIPSNDTFTWQDNADFNKLTIAPDTTIHLTGTGSRIVVYGELIADALDSSNDIVFTSDDSSPQPGNWGYIQFKSGSKGVLDSVQIEYGGNGDSVVFFDGGNASLIRSTIKHINGSGVSFRYETLSTLQQSTITHVSKYAVNAAFNGTTTPTRSYGVSNNYLEGTLGATFLGSSASGAFPVVSGNNTFTVEPTINSVRVSDYTFTQNSEIFRDLVFYGSLTIPSNVELDIYQGVTLFGANRSSRIVVSGQLNMHGHPSNPVTVSSVKTKPAAGDWGYVQFVEGSTGSLKNVIMEYGGDDNYSSYFTNSLGVGSAHQGAVSAILVVESSPTLENVYLRHIADVSRYNNDANNPKAAGVWFRGNAAPSINDLTVEYSESYGVYAQSTVTGAYSIDKLNVSHAGDYGIYISGTGAYALGSIQLNSNVKGGYWNPLADSQGRLSNYTLTGDTTDSSALFITGQLDVNFTATDNIKLFNATTIGTDSSLTINPDIQVYGYDRASRLIVKGELIASGSAAKPITFTSDNETPAAGDWGYVQFAEGSRGSLKNVIMEYGGDDNYSSYSTNSLGVGSAHQGVVSAILVVESSPTLENVYLRHIADVSRYNNDANNPKAAGVWFRGNAAPSINDLTVEYSESYGVYAQSTVTGAYSIDKLNVSHAGDYGIYISGTGAYALGSIQLNSNVKGGYWNPLADSQGRLSNYTLTGDTTDSSALFITGQLDVNFTATDNIKLFNATTIGTDSSLTINPDIQVYGYDRASRLIVKGELIASGSAAKPITFTSDNETPAAGDWGYVQFAEGSRGSLKNVIMEYGGDDNYSSYSTNSLGVGSAHQGVVSAILVVESSPTLENVYLRHIADVSRYNNDANNPKAAGVWFRGIAAPIVHDSLFENIESYAVYSDVTHYLNLSNALTIVGGQSVSGVYSKTAQLNIRNTQWQDSTGPYHADNPNGLGATVVGNVLYKWWKGPDSDGDGLPDYWEQEQGSDVNTANNVSIDLDGDGLNLLEEFEQGTDYSLADTDADGLSDKWEIDHLLNPTDKNDAALDSDKDGLTNYQESLIGTDIWNPDSDGDDSIDSLDALPLDEKDWLDFDKDGVGDSIDLDDDGDGMPDTYEFAHGLDSKDASDAAKDADGDLQSNLAEYLASTDPNNSSDFASEIQKVAASQSLIRIKRGNPFYLKLKYQVSDNNLNLSGLGIRVHYDSASITLDNLKDYYLPDFVAISNVQDDDSDFDNDKDTDVFFTLKWQSQNRTWPGEFSGYIATLKLILLENVVANSTNKINFSALSTAIDLADNGYGFEPTSVGVVDGFAIDLDINGDGKIDGFTDGAIYTRYMLGYPAETLATDEEMTESTRTRQEMYDLLSTIQPQPFTN